MSLTDRQRRERQFYNEYSALHPVESVSLDPVLGDTARPWNSYWTVYQIVRDYRKTSPQRLLDFGCGTGVAALRYASLGYEVHGFDISERNIESCRQLAKRHNLAEHTHFRIQAAERLDFERDYFDIIVGMDILHHVDVPRSMEQVRKVLAPGGLAVFREWVEVPLFESIRNSSLGRRLFPKEASFETHITEDERKLSADDLQIIETGFKDCRVLRFAIFSRLRRILPERAGTRSSRLEQFDHYLIRKLPFVRTLGGEAVLVLRAEY